MRQGLTRAGIGHVGGLERFVQKAAEYGFQAVDTSGKDIQAWIDATGLDGVLASLRQHQVVIGSIGLPVQWRATEAEFRSGLAQLVQDAQAAASLGCTVCCTYIVPSTDYNSAHFMALAVRRLKVCAQLLGTYGIRLGLEFVGPHHQRTMLKHPFIWTASETLDMIEAIGERNVGLLLDSLHAYTAEMSIADIAALRREQIVHVHLNDAPDVPVAAVLDNDRLYPGEGVIDLQAFLDALRHIGYDGVVSQEVLTPHKATEPSDVLLARSRAAFDKVWRGS
ncbi:MAG: xylose isomerase protein [Paenibacillus sp.]|jgi:sugar phosphate isomerase/epimerase|nr:xylose isomerase protein [Paenibacillus sp.]